MSGDDGLREVIVEALRTRIGYREADLILALSEVAALRAKAAAADRVRELADRYAAISLGPDGPAAVAARDILRALDGDGS